MPIIILTVQLIALLCFCHCLSRGSSLFFFRFHVPYACKHDARMGIIGNAIIKSIAKAKEGMEEGEGRYRRTCMSEFNVVHLGKVSVAILADEFVNLIRVDVVTVHGIFIIVAGHILHFVIHFAILRTVLRKVCLA